ncbi:MAG: aminotransferase class V-fold PLP-dependent enzyme [Acidobacteria bacterium]|nr:MAG: aminotransferase class V-fold PLP-dependent enzyme [Acidobacteriota bacterium]
MNVDHIRAQFPGLRDKTFLDAACVSIAPRAAIAAIEEFLHMALQGPERSATLHHIAMDEKRARARREAARLINAGEDEIALVESTTHGLSLAAQALPLERDHRVILCDLEFLQLALPWCQLSERIGIQIDVVSHREGMINVQDIADRITEKTKVVAISSVQWTNGFRCDLDALGALCRDRDIWLIVDAIQQLGAIPIDVQKTPIDILACGGHKWLNAPFGAGFLYVRRERVPDLRPPMAGYLSVETPSGGWGEYFQTPTITPIRAYRFVREARRYEIGGTGNYPGTIGLAASLRLINELGPSRLAEHIFRLTDHLVAGLQTLGIRLVTPIDRQYRSGIITFTMGSVRENVELMEYLLDHRVCVSVRYTSWVGGVRVSCHFYNSPEDVDRLLNLVDVWRRRR